MNGIEFFRLARRLMKTAVRVIPPSEFRDLPPAIRMVLVDVFENPDTTIGQIVDRTGFPQSHVSASVARLRDSGMLVTTVDPTDRRRTLVSPSPEHLAKVKRSPTHYQPIDEALRAVLVQEFGPQVSPHLDEVGKALDVLVRCLNPQPVHVSPPPFEDVTPHVTCP